MTPPPALLDHLVFAAPDLAVAIAMLEPRLGARFVPGGRHPDWGTHNAILSLGPSSYLEVIAPDPDRDAPTPPRLFGLDALGAPRLVTWAAKGSDLTRLVERARARGIDLGSPAAGSRRRPDGSTLRWELTDPLAPRAGGVIPFFIDWGGGAHPASAAPSAVTLIELRLQHPDANAIAGGLRSLGVGIDVTPGPAPAIFADLRAPAGVVTLA